ncbi:MAG TPA: hypothetical protein VF220_01525 [Nitrososphaeraceae archaeon]
MTVSKSIDRNHFKCRNCDTPFVTDFFYPDGISICEDCRKELNIFDKEYYENLWREKMR